MTHVLRYDAMSEQLVQWKRKREPCNIQNVTSISLIPQRGLNESPQVLLSHVLCQVSSHSKYCKRQSATKLLKHCRQMECFGKQNNTQPSPYLPNKVRVASIEA